MKLHRDVLGCALLNLKLLAEHVADAPAQLPAPACSVCAVVIESLATVRPACGESWHRPESYDGSEQ